MATRRRRPCKHGKLKNKTKGRRCRKVSRSRRRRSRRSGKSKRRRRRRSRKSKKCKARFPSSLSSLMSRVLKSARLKQSIHKKLGKLKTDRDAETDPVKKLKKNLAVTELTVNQTKVLDKYQKNSDKLKAKLAEYESKSALNQALTTDEKAKFAKKFDKIMKA